VDVVRQIYAWYLDDHYGDTEIANMLNEKKVPAERTGPWKPWHVKAVLTNEKYMGKVVFNRGTAKLSSPRRLNAREDWICVDNILPPIIEPAVFQRTLDERARRMQPKSQEALLSMLRALHEKHGRVTIDVIDAEKGIPKYKYFSSRFGSIADAYLAAGLPAGKTLQYARTKHSVRQMLHRTMEAVGSSIEQTGARYVVCAHKWSVLINDEVILKAVVSRARHDNEGRIRWRVPIHASPVPDFVLCVQMDTSNVGVMGDYLFPVADFMQDHIILRAECPQDRGEYRYPNLAAIFGATAQ
jgi:hypothetical protein